MSYPQESSKKDRQLVEEILNGDKHAFGLLIKNTEGLVAQMAFKMINSPADRKDIDGDQDLPDQLLRKENMTD